MIAVAFCKPNEKENKLLLFFFFFFEEMFSFFMAVGIYAVAYYLYDNLRTPLLLLYHKWQYRTKQHELILMQKYGKWAGRWYVNGFFF